MAMDVDENEFGYLNINYKPTILKHYLSSKLEAWHVINSEKTTPTNMILMQPQIITYIKSGYTNCPNFSKEQSTITR